MCHNITTSYCENPLNLNLCHFRPTNIVYSDDGYEQSMHSLNSATLSDSINANPSCELLVTFDYGDDLESDKGYDMGFIEEIIEEEEESNEEEEGPEEWQEKFHFDDHDFPVHHVQHAAHLLCDSINSSLSNFTEYQAQSTANVVDNCFSLDSLEENIHKNKDSLVFDLSNNENDDEEEEEEALESLFDSIEYTI